MPRQQASLEGLRALDKDYGVLKFACLAHQAILDCCQINIRRQAKKKIRAIIDQLCVLKGPRKELAQLGRSLFKRFGDVA